MGDNEPGACPNCGIPYRQGYLELKMYNGAEIRSDLLWYCPCCHHLGDTGLYQFGQPLSGTDTLFTITFQPE